MSPSRALLIAAIALSVIFLVGGCGKPKSKDDGLLPRSGDRATSKTTEEDTGDARPNAPDFLWTGNGTAPVADSFGPMGPAPMLLFGAMIEHGNAEVTGSEVAGGLSMALPYMIDLRYERDDDIKADWVKLIAPEDKPQFFAGMAVWGKVNWALAGATGESYEAESAIYLTTTPFDQLVAQYTEAYGKTWQQMDFAPAAQAEYTASAVFLFRSPDDEGLKEVDIAQFSNPAITQVTLSRTVAVSPTVANGLLGLKTESLDVEIPEAPPEETEKTDEGKAKSKATDESGGENAPEDVSAEPAGSKAVFGKSSEASSSPAEGESAPRGRSRSGGGKMPGAD